IDRCSAIAAIPGVALIVVGKLAEVCEVLQAPGLVIARVQQQLAEMEMQLGEGTLVGFGFRQFESLLHQLERADAVALNAVDVAPAAAMVAAGELARD